jgi:hypothetical protein
MFTVVLNEVESLSFAIDLVSPKSKIFIRFFAVLEQVDIVGLAIHQLWKVQPGAPSNIPCVGNLVVIYLTALPLQDMNASASGNGRSA